MSHEGWKNYQTWAIALWIDNEQGPYRYWNDAAQEALDEHADPDTARRELARLLKDEHEESRPKVEGVWSDLLNASLSEVDWFELADHFLADKTK